MLHRQIKLTQVFRSIYLSVSLSLHVVVGLFFLSVLHVTSLLKPKVNIDAMFTLCFKLTQLAATKIQRKSPSRDNDVCLAGTEDES